jgi:hypothetical protein
MQHLIGISPLPFGETKRFDALMRRYPQTDETTRGHGPVLDLRGRRISFNDDEPLVCPPDAATRTFCSPDAVQRRPDFRRTEA